MNNPTLHELSDHLEFENICRKTVIEMFGLPAIRDSMMKLPHGVTDRYWTTGEFFTKLSIKISKEINERLSKELQSKVKKFDTIKTKLTSELVNLDEVWMIISETIAKEMQEAALKGENEIPGLEKGINESLPMLAGGKQKIPDVTLEDRVEAQKAFKEKGKKIDDITLFLTKFRENLFQHFKSKYGIFEGQEPRIDRR